MNITIRLISKVVNFLKPVVLFFIIGASPVLVSAHPHVFMDTSVDFQFGQKGLEGFWVQWHFDEIFTAGILFDFDSDKDKQFSKEEIKEIEAGAFSNLKNFDYFTYVIVKQKKQAVRSVDHFTASIKNNRLIYRFFVPYPMAATDGKQTIKVAAYDETFYCDIAFQKRNAINVTGAEQFQLSHRVQQDMENTINYDNSYQTASREESDYNGLTNPYEIVLTFRRKN